MCKPGNTISGYHRISSFRSYYKRLFHSKQIASDCYCVQYTYFIREKETERKGTSEKRCRFDNMLYRSVYFCTIWRINSKGKKILIDYWRFRYLIWDVGREGNSSLSNPLFPLGERCDCSPSLNLPQGRLWLVVHAGVFLTVWFIDSPISNILSILKTFYNFE